MCDVDNRSEVQRNTERATGVEPRPEARVTEEGYALEEATARPGVPEAPEAEPEQEPVPREPRPNDGPRRI